MIIQNKKWINLSSMVICTPRAEKIDPNYTVKVHEFPHPDINTENYFVPYLATPEGYFVQVSVTVKDSTETEWLPVLTLEINRLLKVVQQLSILTKRKNDVLLKLRLYGLGLYIYNGEELPSASDNDITELEERINQFVNLSQEKGEMQLSIKR